MEIRNGKIIVGAAGGTAGKNAKTYKVSLPSAWIKELGLGEDDRSVQLHFDGHQIMISKPMSFDEFADFKKSCGHELKLLSYYENDTLCTTICADFTDKTLSIWNEDVPNLHRAFGVRELPTWDDFMEFLEDRCIPRERDGLRYYLEALGLDEYDPLAIVQRTEGRMAEDHQWLKVEELSNYVSAGISERQKA